MRQNVKKKLRGLEDREEVLNNIQYLENSPTLIEFERRFSLISKSWKDMDLSEFEEYFA